MRDVSRLVIIVAGGLFVIRGRLSRTVEMVQRMGAGLRRFYEIMDEEPEIRDATDAVELTEVHGRIDFDRQGLPHGVFADGE